MKKIFLTLIALVVGVAAFAQDDKFDWGARLSLGSNQHIYQKGAYDSKEGFALDGGVWGRARLNSWLALRPGVSLEFRGAKIGAVGTGEAYNFSTMGVNVPVDLVWMSEEDTPLYLFAGLYYSGIFGAWADGDSLNIKDNGIRGSEFGWRFGVGVDFDDRWGLELTYKDAFTDVFKRVDDTVRFRNLGAMVSGTYRF